MTKLSDQIRRAVDGAGCSRNSICKATGIDKGQFSRFMASAGGLNVVLLDRLGEFLGLRVSAGRKAVRRG